MTLRERYVRYLTDLGWHRDYSNPQSKKYHKYNHPSKAGWYFLGSNGAIRFNFDNNVSFSYNSEFRVKHMMITWEKQNGYQI